MRNRITKLFNIQFPIIQAGMIWNSGWKLASAVSNAGGLGLIGAGSMYPDVLREHIQKCKKATNKPFGVNVAMLYPNIDEIMHTSETIIVSHKTKRERVLYFSDAAIKEFKKYFTYTQDKLNNFCITSWGNPQKTFHEVSLIQLVNKYMKNVLGENYTSHSFRQGILTSMGSKSVNPRVIQAFIGHQNVSTTLSYIKPTSDDVKRSLIR